MIDFPDPPSNGTDTSDAAAAFIRPHAPALRQRVMDAIHAWGTTGCTMAHICATTGMCRSSVCARVDELRKLRLIVDTGMRRTPPGGRVACKVFMSTDHYGAFLREFCIIPSDPKACHD